MDYLLHIATIVGIYIILSSSLNLIAGCSGLLSIAHAAFYGVGAYVAALMALKLHTPFLVNVACGVVLCGLLGGLVGLPSVRARGHYFVIASFAVQVVTFNVLNNWVSFTGGPLGLPGIPRPEVLGLRLTSHLQFLILVACFCSLNLGVCYRVMKSPFGRVLKAIREDETFALAAGKNVTTYKVWVFVTGAAAASTAGALYAYYASFIDPTSFTVMESILIVSIVIIGGAGSFWGPVVGSVVLLSLPEMLRFIGLPSGVSANMRQILYGTLLIVFMMWRPQGLIGEYSFQESDSKR